MILVCGERDTAPRSSGLPAHHGYQTISVGPGSGIGVFLPSAHPLALPDGSLSCADILALKKSAGPADNQQAEDYAAIHAIAFSALPHLIDVLESAPHLGQEPKAAEKKF